MDERKPALRTLRRRLAVTGFAAAYAPVLLVLTVSYLSYENVDITSDSGSAEVVISRGGFTPWVVSTVVALAPITGFVAWWWSGRAVRPVERAMALQEQLIEDASHELRTPLSVLSTNAEVLLAHPDPDVDLYRQGIARSHRVASGLIDTVEALLIDARSRSRTVELAPTDLMALCQSVCDSLAPLATARRIELRAPSGQSVRAPVDADSVSRAVSNLVANAIEHGPGCATVDVSVTSRPGWVEIAIADQGPGIDPGRQAQLFERYWRSERDGSGSGLGLAIVDQVARAHGGTVTVESPIGPDGGTAFRLLLVAS